ncbi:MAG: DinB family protein [Chitinophagaceae bacterium]
MPSSIATRLQYQHKCLLDILNGLSDEQIRLQLYPAKWSLFEIIVHLQTYQHSFISRIRRILNEENPIFTPYRAEADPLFHENCTKSSREIIQDLLAIRKELSANALSFKEMDLKKEADHPVYGQMNLLQWLNFFLLHEAHHLFIIFKMSAELKKGIGNKDI